MNCLTFLHPLKHDGFGSFLHPVANLHAQLIYMCTWYSMCVCVCVCVCTDSLRDEVCVSTATAGDPWPNGRAEALIGRLAGTNSILRCLSLG